MDLRSAVNEASNLPFFLNYVRGKCTKQCVGINKLGDVPKQIAIYLGLPEATAYTGHCFRRSSATILVDAGGDLLDLKRHGGWQSSAVAEGYVDNSLNNQNNNSSKISSAIANTSSTINEDFIETTNSNNINLTYASTSKRTNIPYVFNNCSVTINNYYGKNS